MAAQTQSAVDALLGLLTTAIKDEAMLLGGVPGDLQFIKDEMDSMNGFLKYLNKMEDHDDQVRAWMKQVREVSYIAEDCVDCYVRDIAPYLYGGPCSGFMCISMTCFLLRHPCKYPELHKLGKQLAELKLRVREVGERRQRYDVSVPDRQQDVKLQRLKAQQEDGMYREEEETREEFRHAVLEEKLNELLKNHGGDLFAAATRLSEAAVAKLPPDHVLLRARSSEDDSRPSKTVHGILVKCCWQPPTGGEGAAAAAAEAALPVIKMILCAIYVYPYATDQELTKLSEKLEKGGGTPEANREQVMLFCYSMLSTQEKSCLQYLTAFLHESEISRTSMVRRWIAEGLVGKLDQAGAGMSGSGSTAAAAPPPHPEEAGERCFRELVFRGFVRPRRFSDAGTVKSCVMEEPITGFVCSITRSENFLLELPAHLDRQLKIREIVQEGRRSSLSSPLPPPPPPPTLYRRWRNAARRCNLCSSVPSPEDDARRAKDPMDKLVDFLKGLPEMYRLNVLDLGGCKGFKGRHLESFGKQVPRLKYLSLRKTDVSRLKASHINRLTLLETLDIRETNIPPGDTKKIYLPKLKHLLADRHRDRRLKLDGEAMRMPDMIGEMKNMETLSHVQVSNDGAELEGVVRLRSRQQLRKLGVVVHGNQSTAAYLGRVLYALAGCLRSLSIWVVTQTQTQTLDIPSMPPESSRVLENLDIKGKMTSFPSWIGGRDEKLANVTLRDTEINGGEALRRLGCVPKLHCLRLVGQAFTEQALVFKDDVCFKALRVLVIQGNDAITSMAFDSDKAAPKLEKIVWAIGSSGGGGDSDGRMMTKKKTATNDDGHLITVSGIHNLPRLKVIELRGDFKLPNLLEELKKKDAKAPPNPNKSYDKSYCCRYVSSDGNNLIYKDDKVPVVASDAHASTRLSLPVRVINQQQ